MSKLDVLATAIARRPTAKRVGLTKRNARKLIQRLNHTIEYMDLGNPFLRGTPVKDTTHWVTSDWLLALENLAKSGPLRDHRMILQFFGISIRIIDRDGQMTGVIYMQTWAFRKLFGKIGDWNRLQNNLSKIVGAQIDRILITKTLYDSRKLVDRHTPVINNKQLYLTAPL